MIRKSSLIHGRTMGPRLTKVELERTAQQQLFIPLLLALKDNYVIFLQRKRKRTMSHFVRSCSPRPRSIIRIQLSCRSLTKSIYQTGLTETGLQSVRICLASSRNRCKSAAREKDGSNGPHAPVKSSQAYLED